MPHRVIWHFWLLKFDFSFGYFAPSGLSHLFGIPCQPLLILQILPCGELSFSVLELLPRPLCFHSLFYFLVTALASDLTASLLMPCTNMLILWSHGACQNYLLLQSWFPVVLASCSLFRRTPGTGLILIRTCWVGDKMGTSEISNGVKFTCQACIFIDFLLNMKLTAVKHTQTHTHWRKSGRFRLFIHPGCVAVT